MRAGIVQDVIALDGSLDESAWQHSALVPDLTQQSPRPGEPTPFHTTVRILADSQTIYFGVEAFDPEPSRIAVHTLQRDGNLDGDDTVAFLLDTFGDGRTGYFFQVNAAGARLDGLVSGPEELSLDWDGIWDARTRRTAHGWTAEIAIPSRTLRFAPGLDRWGFNVARTIARERMVLQWAGASLDAKFEDASRAGVLVGLEGLKQGLGLSIAPYGLGRWSRDSERKSGSLTGDAGLDVGYNFTPQLSGVLTINTEFAETEADTRQVNLERFPLFFPEKRPFFLEGSNLFEFGLGLVSRLSFIPFYSRRVGLFQGEVVPIDAGGKLLGRAGRWQLAVLDAQTGDSRVAPGTNLFAGRATYDVDEHLRVGALATNGDPDGIRENRLAGLDAVWRTSTFLGDKNLFAGLWGAWTGGDAGRGKRNGFGGKLDYPNDLWDVSLTFNEFGGALDPALGFLPRPGTRQYRLGMSYQPRPAGGPFDWVRQFFFEFVPRLVERLDGTTESWEVFTAPFNARTESGEHLEANWDARFERLDFPFEIARGVVVPPGGYRFERYRVEAESSEHRPWRVAGRVWFGGFYGGRLTQYQVEAGWTSPAGHLQLALESENDFGRLPGGKFIQRLWQARAVYAFHPDLVVSSFLQYDSESRNVGLNARLRWTLHPGNDVFLVWNKGWLRPLGETGYALRSVSDQVTLKLRWTWRG